ncbi:hypothetical protein HOE22_05690 [Candidatus Woesearchaeota archaeon]|jgi:hypothetical protein|nr:hypothetical protein [Candidatus Woesearchaeota archaeon]MBT7558308.1 hypothetical protein [Candidatus Woesearchaeota archaeon]
MKLSKDDIIDAVGFLNFLIERNLISPEEMPQNNEQLKIWFKRVRTNIDRTEAILMWMNRDSLPQA